MNATSSGGVNTAERANGMLDRLMRAVAAAGDDVDRLAQDFCVITAETFGGMCSMTLLNQHNEMMHIAGLHDVDPRAMSLVQDMVSATADLPRDQGLAAHVIRSGEPLLVESITLDQEQMVKEPAMAAYMQEVGVGSVMAVPLKGRSGVLGQVSVTRHRGAAPFNADDLSLLTGIVRHIATAVENQQLVASLRREIAAGVSARRALDASEERFRSIFESTTLGIELMDALGTVLDVNPAYERMTGFTGTELIGRRFGAALHPEDAVPVLRLLTEVRMQSEPGAPVENRLLCKDGSTLWVRTNFAAIKKGPGDRSLAYIIAVHEDVSRRKETERYFQAVLEAMPDALVMVDAQGEILLVNRQTEVMFGYGRHELLGWNVDNLIPERLRASHPLHRAGYLQDPHVRPMGAELELFGLRKDGSEFPVDISLSGLQAEKGPVVVAAIRDITERKRRQDALARSERTLSEAQKVARLGSLDYDIANQTVDASDEALRILGIPRDQFRGSESIRAAMHPDDEQRVVDGTYAAVENHTAADLEFRVVHSDGSVHIVHDRVIGVYDADGKPVRMVGTVQDVTEQRQAEQEVAELRNHLQSSVELERLRLAQDLHDGPMQELYGSSYRLDELIKSAETNLAESLAQVNKDIEHTIDELRTIAKELRPPAISNFGLEKAIRSYVEDFHEKHPKIDLHLSLAHDRLLLPENMRLTLFRVLQQALTNVVRHSQANEVRVRFSLDAEEARLEVADNGMGFTVPANWMGFVRHGHYGLAGAAERVSALGGILLVDSAPERSTTITAVIPWTPAAPQAESESQQA
jgi:PAS domain S-box-containing protein